MNGKYSEIQALKQEIMESLHCALPGEVVEYYADEGTADIQPTIKTRSGIQLPILRNVPVFYWGRYNFNPREGDGCLVVFSDLCIDDWIENGGVSENPSDRKHDISDGFAFVGFRVPDRRPIEGGSIDVVSKEADGLCPRLPDELTTQKFFRQDGTWSIPPNTEYGVVSRSQNGLAPMAPSGEGTTKFLREDGTWMEPPTPEPYSNVILSYGNSTWQDFMDAYSNNAVIYCRASSGSNPAAGAQLRMAFLAYLGTSATNPTEVEFQYYRSVKTKSDSAQGDEVYIYTLKPADGGTWSYAVRKTYSPINVGANLAKTYSNGAITLNTAFQLPLSVENGGTGMAEVTRVDDTTKGTPHENFTLSHLYITKWGKLVMVQASLRMTTATTGNITILTLAEDLRPAWVTGVQISTGDGFAGTLNAVGAIKTPSNFNPTTVALGIYAMYLLP